MSEDLISGFNVSDVNKSLLKKNSRLALILLIFTVLYFLVESKYWFDIFNSDSKTINLQHAFYLHKISPIISFSEMIVNVIIGITYYNAWKSQSVALDSEDISMFNKSIKLFNISLILSCSYFLLAFLRMLLRAMYYN
jgi:hypothetical protein